MRLFPLYSRIIGTLLISFFLSACVPRKSYQIGEEGSISYQYYQGCLGLADLGKQFIGSIRSASIGGTEDVCGCQAELIYQQGLYVSQPPNDQEFKECFKGVVNTLTSNQAQNPIEPADSKLVLSNRISPLFAIVLLAIPVVLVLLFIRYRNESED
jgi:hypothetical protein